MCLHSPFVKIAHVDIAYKLMGDILIIFSCQIVCCSRDYYPRLVGTGHLHRRCSVFCRHCLYAGIPALCDDLGVSRILHSLDSRHSAVKRAVHVQHSVFCVFQRTSSCTVEQEVEAGVSFVRTSYFNDHDVIFSGNEVSSVI